MEQEKEAETKILVEVIGRYSFAHRGCDLEYFNEVGEIREVTEECAKLGVRDGAFKPYVEKLEKPKAVEPEKKQKKGPAENK